MKKINIAWAWWGTWGHVFPIKSLIQYLDSTRKYKEKVASMVWFWKKGSLEEENYKLLKSSVNNVSFSCIFSGKWRREKSFFAFCKNIRDLFLFSFWVLQSIVLLKKHHIDVVFCNGGYVALPVVFAAKFLGKRIIVHESDVHPWLVNRIASKYANVSFTWFDWVFPKAVTVWQILSEDLLPKRDIQPSKATNVFVMGGSQGSKDLYEALSKVIKRNKALHEMKFFVVLWKLNKTTWALFSEFDNVKCYEFLSQKEMWEHYLDSDIAITRAWTTSLAEQHLFNLKLIMVPIPRTHDQKDNAKWYVKHHDGILIEQDDPQFLEKLEETLLSLKSYKKLLSWEDRKAIINVAKEKIIKAIIYS